MELHMISIKEKGHNNKRLESNPKIGETDVAYLRRQLNINDKKNYSSNVYFDYKMSKNDDDYVTSLIEKRKQKKK